MGSLGMVIGPLLTTLMPISVWCADTGGNCTLTSPLPRRAPFLLTAELPTTIMSTVRPALSLRLRGSPYLATPADVQASIMAFGGKDVLDRVEKNPVRSRG